jgi:putative MFS transporter
MTALCWSFVNFGLLLWLPSDLQARGYSAEVASGILAKSSLLAFPTVLLAALFYARRSTKWTLVGTIGLTFAGLIGAILPPSLLSWEPVLIAVIAMLIVGTNGTIAVLLPYTAENYPSAPGGGQQGWWRGAASSAGWQYRLRPSRALHRRWWVRRWRCWFQRRCLPE